MKAINEKPQTQTEPMLTAGQILRAYRERKDYDLKEISVATKIPLHQLAAIERDEYGTYENQVFIRGFVKNYAEYLGLDKEKVLAIYRRTSASTFKNQINRKKNQSGNTTETTKPRNIKEMITRIELTPAKVITVLSVILILFIAIFLFTQFYKFQSPPKLELNSPENNLTVETDEIDVKGNTEENSIIKVNDALTSTTPQGEFSTKVKLVPGVNTIVVKAYKNSNEQRANVITRNITYKKVEVAQKPVEQTPVVPTTFKVKVQVDKEPAWIMLVLDDKQIIASILPVGTTKEYEFSKSLSASSGKPSSSKLIVNEADTPFVINYTTGTATLECQIKDNKLDCAK